MRAVTQFGPGQRVFGVNADRFGAHAEYVCVKEGGPIGTTPPALADAESAAVCDTVHVDAVRSLGPDAMIDYTTDDFARRVAPGEQYDVVFDAVGKISLGRCRA